MRFNSIVAYFLVICCLMTNFIDNNEVLSTSSNSISANGIIRGMSLYEKNANEPMNTKLSGMLMTVVIALEELNLNEYIYISEHAEYLDNSSVNTLGFKKDQYKSVSYLICAILYQESDASAYALREHLVDNNEQFTQKLNTKAQSLGMSSTVFYEPASDKSSFTEVFSKHDSTTSSDINILFRHALYNIDFKYIFTRYRNVFISLDGSPDIINNQATSIKASILEIDGVSYFTSNIDDSICILATSFFEGFEVAYVFIQTPRKEFAQEIENVTQHIHQEYSFSPLFLIEDIWGPVLLVDYDIQLYANFSNDVYYIHPKNERYKIIDHIFVPYEYYSNPIQKGTPLGIVYFTLENDLIIPAEIVASQEYSLTGNRTMTLLRRIENNANIIILCTLILIFIISIGINKIARSLMKYNKNISS